MSIFNDWWQKALFGLLLLTTITSRFGYAPNDFWYNAGLILPVAYLVIFAVVMVVFILYIFKAHREPLPTKS